MGLLAFGAGQELGAGEDAGGGGGAGLGPGVFTGGGRGLGAGAVDEIVDGVVVSDGIPGLVDGGLRDGDILVAVGDGGGLAAVQLQLIGAV